MRSIQSTRAMRLLATLLATALLWSCKSSSSFVPLDDDPRLPSKVRGTSDPQALAIQKQLTRQGVQVVSMGQDYLVAIPANLLFPEQSPQLTWGSYNVLNTVACYLKEFRKTGVTVTSYNSRYISAERERALSIARARAVGDYLWSQGIDTRLLFTEGAGSDKPVTAVTQGGDGSPNARVEITFRNAIV